MRIPEQKPFRERDRPADAKKPGLPRRLPGLLLYGALTILGGLALVAVAE